jgi:2,4-dienoyl-CoA reductase-like NADH-dependent reductase (Old Yellow Enzyme family)
MRFVVEAIRAVKKQVDQDYPVMIKLGVRDYLAASDAPVWGASMGRTAGLAVDPQPADDTAMTIDQGAAVAAAVEKEGVCHIEISNGFLGKSSYKIHMGITSPEKEAYLLDEARVIRQNTTGPLSLVAGMRSLPVMERIIESGVVDGISICRPFIREPDLITRWRSGDTNPATCISCGGCFNTDESGNIQIYCRQLKKEQERRA